jgi:DNA-binding MarR family transcriptional regulator
VRAPDAPTRSAATAVIEYELVTLTRWLEMLSRRSTIYEQVDRAGSLVLRTLAEGPLRTTQVADVLRLDASTATRQIAALEASGFVRRIADPSDGRASRIEMTGQGSEVLREVERRRRDLLEALLEGWDDDARASFAQCLLTFNRCLRAHSWPDADYTP